MLSEARTHIEVWDTSSEIKLLLVSLEREAATLKSKLKILKLCSANDATVSNECESKSNETVTLEKNINKLKSNKNTLVRQRDKVKNDLKDAKDAVAKI